MHPKFFNTRGSSNLLQKHDNIPVLLLYTCWSQASKTILGLLESLHKQSLKILDGKPRQHHHCTIVQKYRLLNFDNIQKCASIRMTQKILNNCAPAPLKNFIKYTSTVTTRSTRAFTSGQCNIPQLKTISLFLQSD